MVMWHNTTVRKLFKYGRTMATGILSKTKKIKLFNNNNYIKLPILNQENYKWLLILKNMKYNMK